MRSIAVACAGLAVAAAGAPARADEAYELGVRVGGYGFRRDGDDNRLTQWTECRMDGVGVFGSRALTGPLFVEAGLDLYASTNFHTAGAEHDLPIARTSGLASVAIGARAQLAARVRGYLQLGAGAELTRVAVPYGDAQIRDAMVMPTGFFGVGIDVRVARRTHVGATFRALAMGNFDYDPARLDPQRGWAMAPSPGEVFAATADAATQGQFYLRHEL